MRYSATYFLTMAMGLFYKKNASEIDDISVTGEKTAISTKDKLLKAIHDDSGLPSLGSSISYIIQLSSSEDE